MPEMRNTWVPHALQPPPRSLLCKLMPSVNQNSVLVEDSAHPQLESHCRSTSPQGDYQVRGTRLHLKGCVGEGLPEAKSVEWTVNLQGRGSVAFQVAKGPGSAFLGSGWALRTPLWGWPRSKATATGMPCFTAYPQSQFLLAAVRCLEFISGDPLCLFL